MHTLERARACAEEAMDRGFTVWCNADATSAFLYGAKTVTSTDQSSEEVIWISKVTVPTKQGQALVRLGGNQQQLLQISHMSF